MNQIASLRQRSHLWYANYTARQRCAAVGRVRHEIVQQADKLIAAAKSPQRTNDKETLAAELIPLCDALRWIAGKGPRLLADRTPRWWSRPLWLWGTRPRVRRVPHGVVLILGTWNYSMLLAGVQAAQAIAAGNAVLWKPAPGCESATRMLIDCFLRSLPNDTETPLIQMLPSDASAAVDAMRQSVDMVVLTGGYDTGRAVLKQSVDSMTPCLLELSGCDAMIVVPNAPTRKTGSDQRNRNYLDRVADHAVNALTLNSGATCIGPRRMLVHR
ncbi:MAG: aldehyde dehydrogenase family protein, partial [Planctomycetota bacterium]